MKVDKLIQLLENKIINVSLSGVTHFKIRVFDKPTHKFKDGDTLGYFTATDAQLERIFGKPSYMLAWDQVWDIDILIDGQTKFYPLYIMLGSDKWTVVGNLSVKYPSGMVANLIRYIEEKKKQTPKKKSKIELPTNIKPKVDID